MKQNKVVITGSGCVTPLGGNVDETWSSPMAGRNAIGPIEKFDARTYPTTFAAEIKDFEAPSLPHRLERWADLKTQYALCAVREALTQSNLNAAQLQSERIGISIAWK